MSTIRKVGIQRTPLPGTEKTQLRRIESHPYKESVSHSEYQGDGRGDIINPKRAMKKALRKAYIGKPKALRKWFME